MKELNKDLLYNKNNKNDKNDSLINFLLNIGCLKKASTLNLYHGRTESLSSNEEWEVDPQFINKSNTTGNRNINKISALSCSFKKEVAEEFALARSLNNNSKGEVYQIVTKSDDLYFVDKKFKADKMLNDEKKMLANYISNMLSYISTYIDVDFKYFNNTELVEDIFKLSNKIMMENVSESVFVKSHNYLDILEKINTEINSKYRLSSEEKLEIEKLVIKFLSCYNTGLLFIYNPAYVISGLITSNRNDFGLKYDNITCNSDMILKICDELGIIGCILDVKSATIMKTIRVASVFDLDKIGTKNQIENSNTNAITKEFGINDLKNKSILNNDKIESLKKLSNKELIENAIKNTNLGKRFYESANVWEGFTIGQHTETALDCFDNCYNLEVTKDAAILTKIVIMAHDLEKNISKADDDNTHQKTKDFISELTGIDKKGQQLIVDIIYKSQQYTTDYFVKKNPNALKMLKGFCTEVLNNFYNKLPTKNQIDGLMNICIMLQSVDSFAYTPYATTRSKNIKFNNCNKNFALNFEPPYGLLKNKSKFKNVSELSNDNTLDINY